MKDSLKNYSLMYVHAQHSTHPLRQCHGCSQTHMSSDQSCRDQSSKEREEETELEEVLHNEHLTTKGGGRS